MTPSDSLPQDQDRQPANHNDEQALRLVIDFTATSTGLGWYVVNDNVMGGRSEGGFRVTDGELVFTGRTNTRGGGFSSIRSRPMQLDLSAKSGIRLRVRGDGRRYTWRLTTDARAQGREIAYWAEFDSGDGGWQEVDIPFSAFVPRFRGGGAQRSRARHEQDHRNGPHDLRQARRSLRLQLESVHAYAAAAP